MAQLELVHVWEWIVTLQQRRRQEASAIPYFFQPAPWLVERTSLVHVSDDGRATPPCREA
jgi:hypothetical protein